MLEEIKGKDVWSIENMEAHIGQRLEATVVGVEYFRQGSGEQRAFVYYRTPDERYWYKSCTDTEGIRIESSMDNGTAHQGS